MTWDYRVLVDTYKGEEFFQIHEVYYDEDGIANGATKEAVTVFSEDGVKDIGKVLRKMLKAVKEPVLWATEGRFPEEYEK